ncbi:LuxR family transcriptional regulator [Rhodopseudomonas sp. AAP120]|uniref:helix-turn-helix transcriptional regulator n=1 Tax=Rhodopseudomonas sp. AAP120 TaxID=1523430 RepID=UPI0006B8E607|nr:LuxR C-terminal-related transcriptional regulator [Rhodopseudomonas sp. AAP120]KPG00647.1 LuxR family transcriptional regulator [Rhodopseudomonas sp. AAP120]
MLSSSLSKIIKGVGISALVIDRTGRILEVGDEPEASGPDKARSKLGKSYFDACIRPDRHSLELLRGFKSLAERSIDFFATVSWREEAGERKHFLIVATPCDEDPNAIVVLHIDLSVLLGGRRELSALMIGQGAAAAAQVEAAMIGAVRGAIVDALATSQGRTATLTIAKPPREPQVLHELTPSQLELLPYLASGKSNRQIAKERDMSVFTVKSQVAGIIQKLNVTNRTQAALFAMRNSEALGLRAQA